MLRAGGPIVIPDRGDEGATLTAPQKVRDRRQGSNSGPFRLTLLAAAAQPRLAPRSQAPMRAAARANRVAPTAYASGIVAAAIGTTADVSAARRGRFREVRSRVQALGRRIGC